MSLKEIACFFKPERIEIQAGRCLNPRHRLEYCDVCARVCSQQAVSVSENGVLIETMLCNNCGLCVSDCPTGVFRHENFDVFNLLAWAQNKEEIHISCQAATVAAADEASIPCHGMLAESLLAALYGNGIARVYLHGLEACESCPTRAGKPRIEAVKQYIHNKIPAMQLQIELHTGDKTSAVEYANKATGLTNEPVLPRRRFLSVFARKSAAMIMPIAVKHLVEDRVEQDVPADIGSDEETLMHKHIPEYHRLSLLALFSNRCESDTSGFYEITANGSCTGCQVCAVRCPTGALSWHDQADEVRLEYRTLACIGCGLCISVCPSDALNMIAQQDFELLCDDQRALLFRSQQQKCACCGEHFLACDNDTLYCRACSNEMDIKKQWPEFHFSGPKDR